jgi:hypothetical protein
MLRDNLAGLIEPMIDCAGVHALMDSARLATAQHESHRTIDPQCLENPHPEGAESTLTENAPSPFLAEPRQHVTWPVRSSEYPPSEWQPQAADEAGGCFSQRSPHTLRG